jgi:hypothetical protein
MHPRRSARHHLLALAQSNGIARSRVDEVLGLVGLDKVAGRRVGRLLAPAAASVRQESDTGLLVSGLSTDDIGDLAYAGGIRLHELTLHSASLEEAYLELSRHSLDYGTSQLQQEGA